MPKNGTAFAIAYVSMSQAQDMLSKYIAAETRILDGQTVRWGDRSLTYADLAEIRNGRREWEAKVANEERRAAGGGSTGYSVADFS